VYSSDTVVTSSNGVSFSVGNGDYRFFLRHFEVVWDVGCSGGLRDIFVTCYQIRQWDILNLNSLGF